MGFVGSNYFDESIGGHHCSYALGVLVPVAFDKVEISIWFAYKVLKFGFFCLLFGCFENVG